MQNSVYLREIMGRLKISGLWQPDLKRPYDLAYRLYSDFMLIYFLVFLTLQFVDIYLYPEKMIENSAIILFCTTTLGKITVLKTSKIKDLIVELISYERRVFNSFSYSKKLIYLKHVGYFHKLNVLLISMGITTTFAFVLRPMVEIYLIRPKNNNSTLFNDKPLPLNSWYPCDKNIYYYQLYTFQMVGICYTASAVVFIDGLLLGFMLFITARIRILNDGLERLNADSDKEDMMAKKARNCIIEHLKIISYVKELDGAIYYLMLLDFATCSLQMASTGFWMIVTDWGIQLAVILVYLASMTIQLFLFYGFANFIIVESKNTAYALWNSKWYECENAIKKNMLLMMLRAQIPLRLSVGPFYAMSNQTAVMIIKAAYSSTALLSKVYHRNN